MKIFSSHKIRQSHTLQKKVYVAFDGDNDMNYYVFNEQKMIKTKEDLAYYKRQDAIINGFVNKNNFLGGG